MKLFFAYVSDSSPSIQRLRIPLLRLYPKNDGQFDITRTHTWTDSDSLHPRVNLKPRVGGTTKLGLKLRLRPSTTERNHQDVCVPNLRRLPGCFRLHLSNA